MLKSTGTICVAAMLALCAQGALAEEWVKGIFVPKLEKKSIDIPVKPPKDRFVVIKEEQKQINHEKADITYIIDKDELNDDSEAASKIAKGNLCNLNTKTPHLSGYNLDRISYVIPCRERRMPKYQLR